MNANRSDERKWNNTKKKRQEADDISKKLSELVGWAIVLVYGVSTLGDLLKNLSVPY